MGSLTHWDELPEATEIDITDSLRELRLRYWESRYFVSELEDEIDD